MATILLAEGQSDMRELLVQLLGERGYTVLVAVDQLEALATLGAQDLDIVLADTRGIDGTQVRAWKQIAPETEVIVAANHEDLAGAIDCVKGGAFDYIEKPYALHTLVTTLERALERRQLRVASTLYETSRVILTAREPSRLPEVIVSVAIKAMNADDVALLVPGDDAKLHVACSTALTESVRREVQASMDALTQHVSSSLREPVITQHGNVSSCILYPLTAGDRLAGVLEISRVINPRRFGRSDVDKAAVLASQTLLALENMRLLRHAISNERLAVVGQVATSIAHEVNNPLAYVLASQAHAREQSDHLIGLAGRMDGGTEVLELRARIAELRQALDDVRDGAERVRDILRDTRALAQSHDTAISLDIHEPIRSALRIIAAELRHRTSVTTKFADDLYVLGRSGRLAQVFVNLLVHTAEKFDENPSNAIVISTKATGGHVVVDMRDNGPSTPPERLPRLFDPFFTMNLAIARDIVRSHGGEISVESPESGGTAYTIVLPQVTAPRRRNYTETPVALGAARLRILLIDDEPNILKAYKRALGNAHEVVFASHGKEALAAIETQGDFDLVICDVSMPTMSGMQLFEIVRKSVPALAEKFVFATGGATQKSVEQFLASIPNLVLEKPFEMSLLRDLVTEILRTS